MKIPVKLFAVYAAATLLAGAAYAQNQSPTASGNQGQGATSQENTGTARQLNQTTRNNPQALNTALHQISTQTGVPLDQIQAQRQKYPQMGTSGLVFANVLAAETKKSPESFLQERQSGKAWQAIAQENNVPFDRLNTRLDRVWNSVAPTAGTDQ